MKRLTECVVLVRCLEIDWNWNTSRISKYRSHYPWLKILSNVSIVGVTLFEKYEFPESLNVLDKYCLRRYNWTENEFTMKSFTKNGKGQHNSYTSWIFCYCLIKRVQRAFSFNLCIYKCQYNLGSRHRVILLQITGHINASVNCWKNVITVIITMINMILLIII